MIKSHYVPQFYLKNFSITGKPERVYVYRRDHKDPVDMDVGKVAAVKGFYSAKLVTTGEESEAIETMFAALEGLTAAVFKRLLNDKKVVVSNDELGLLSMFLSFLHVRGRSFRQKRYQLQGRSYGRQDCRKGSQRH